MLGLRGLYVVALAVIIWASYAQGADELNSDELIQIASGKDASDVEFMQHQLAKYEQDALLKANSLVQSKKVASTGQVGMMEESDMGESDDAEDDIVHYVMSPSLRHREMFNAKHDLPEAGLMEESHRLAEKMAYERKKIAEFHHREELMEAQADEEVKTDKIVKAGLAKEGMVMDHGFAVPAH